MTTAIAGYKGKVSISGTPTATTGEACSHTSGNTYQVTSSSKRILDPSQVLGTGRIWYDNGSAVDPDDITSEDLLFGKVTFGYVPTGPVTVDANYVPTAAVADVKDASLTDKQALVDTTKINSNGAVSRTPTLNDTSGKLGLFATGTEDLNPGAATESFRSLLQARTYKLLELDPDGTGTYVFRDWVLFEVLDISLAPNAVITANVSFQGHDLSVFTDVTSSIASASWGVP